MTFYGEFYSEMRLEIKTLHPDFLLEALHIDFLCLRFYFGSKTDFDEKVAIISKHLRLLFAFLISNKLICSGQNCKV